MTRLRSLLRLVVVLTTIWLVLMLCGCQARETNLALQQSDQAVEASQQVLAQRVAVHVATLPVDVQAEVKAAMDQVCSLLTSARVSMRPAMVLTTGNEPPPQPITTVQQAIDQPAAFISEAAKQAGKAEVEVERIGWYLRIGNIALQWGTTAASSLLGISLTGGGGLLLTIAGILKHLKTARALTDAVAFGNDAATATPKELPEVLDRHKKQQAAHGTKDLIKRAGAAVSAPEPPVQAAIDHLANPPKATP